MLIFNLARPFSVFYLMHKSIGQRKLCFHLNVFFDLFFFSLSHKSMAQLLLFFVMMNENLTENLHSNWRPIRSHYKCYCTIYCVCRYKNKKTKERREKKGNLSPEFYAVSREKPKSMNSNPRYGQISFLKKLFTIEYAERKRFIWLFFSRLFSPFCMCKTISTWFSLEGKLKC